MKRPALFRPLLLAALISPAVSCAADAGARTGRTPAPTVMPTVVHRPAGISPTRRVPLFLVLGGYASIGRFVDGNTGMNAVADAHGFVVAYPTSVSLFNGKPAWLDAGTMPRDDVVHISRAISSLVAAGGIDPARVFVVGTSLGGSMAYRVGCELSSQVAGVGAVSGVMFMKTCKPHSPVSVLTIVGDSDTSFPLAGKPKIAAPGKTSARWAAIDGCTQTGSPTAAGKITTQSWSGCRGQSRVGLDIVAGGAHGWPGVRPFNSGEAFWSFFANVRRRKSSRP